MKKFNFDRRVDRKGAGSLKEFMTPERVKEEGLVSYWGAEFDFPSCPAFSEGVMECARRGLYAFTIQNDVYNQRVSWWMKEMRNWNIDAEWIVPTNGTIFGLATAIRMFVQDEDQLLVLMPTYNRYEQAATRMGLKTIYSQMIYQKPSEKSQSSPSYQIDFTDLEQKMADPNTKLLVICNPNNPTGTVLRELELKKIAALSDQYQVPVYCDEIFAEVIIEGDPVIPYGKIAGEHSLSMTCTSLGKCMSLTGVNHANILIPNPVLREAYNKQKYADHYGSLDPMLYAGLVHAYTEDGKEFVEELQKVIRTNVAMVEEFFHRYLPKARMIHPQATYVIWVDYSDLGMNDQELQQFLHEEALFYGDTGNDYGANGQFYRYSIAVPEAEMRRSLEYLKCAILQREQSSGSRKEV